MSDTITIILFCIVLLLTCLLIACWVFYGKRTKSLHKQISTLREDLERRTAENVSGKSAIYESVCRIHLYSQMSEEEADTRFIREKQEIVQTECEKILEVLSQLTVER